MESSSVDALVTDPPAGIAFMGKDWDKDKGGRDSWVAWMTEVMRECMRVLKPGAHGLVWALPRTSHWTATALENAGFEIRDVVTHLFGTGFPKSLDVSKAIDKAAGAKPVTIGRKMGATNVAGLKHDDAQQSGGAYMQTGKYINETAPATDSARQWQGWGTALKPASEHWVLVRKPCSEKTVAANVLKWGTGAINVDASRIVASDQAALAKNWDRNQSECNKSGAIAREGGDLKPIDLSDRVPIGRFPANLVLDEEAAAMLDEQSGISPSNRRSSKIGDKSAGITGWRGTEANPPGDSGGASRFFYVAKASKTDRGADNKHPTVKSTKLMSYLCRLVTPPGGLILDPFAGSGSTGVAAKAEGFRFLGIEKDAEYIKIAEKRMSSPGLLEFPKEA